MFTWYCDHTAYKMQHAETNISQRLRVLCHSWFFWLKVTETHLCMCRRRHALSSRCHLSPELETSLTPADEPLPNGKNKATSRITLVASAERLLPLPRNSISVPGKSPDWPCLSHMLTFQANHFARWVLRYSDWPGLTYLLIIMVRRVEPTF